jgi:type II secretory pathway pseudopilin PulG
MGATRRQSGLTLLEVTISAVVVLIVVTGAYAVLFTGVDAYATGTSIAEVEKHAVRALDEIAKDVATAGGGNLFPVASAPASSDTIYLQRNCGYTAGAVVWGPTVCIRLQEDPEDPDDGVDNNGNGVIDERRVVRIENVGEANERTVVVTRWVREYLEGEVPNGVDDNGNGLVDERGLAIECSGSSWTLRLTIERPDTNGNLRTRTVETTVTPRND